MGWRDSIDKPSKQTIKETHYSGKKKREFSDEHRLKIGVGVKARWEDPSFREEKEEMLRRIHNRSRKSQEQILQDFKQTHGDRYDYSKVEYVNYRTKVIIICYEHGEFLQTPPLHKRSGCPKCGYEIISRKRSGSKCSDERRLKTSVSLKKRYEDPVYKERRQNQTLQDFKQTHGDRYDYSKVEYVGSTLNVVIICPEHGEFLQLPRDHRKGRGCPKCERNRKIETRTRELIEQFREIHGDRYDYSKVEYVGSKVGVIIICRIHGEFLQVISRHRRGRNCPTCASKTRKLSHSK